MKSVSRVALACLTVLTLFAGIDSARAEAPDTLTDEEKAAGWTMLFDGKSAEGWRGYKKDTVPDGWAVLDGALKRVGRGGDIITADQYDFFELSLEWNMPQGGNSGIIYRVAETDGPSYSTGPEVQVLSNMSPGSKTSAGSCYALYAPSKDVLKPNGEWNHVRLIIHPDNRVEHWMNGEKVCEYVLGSDDWNKRVAESKFAKMPKFGKVAKGHICLQEHGSEVWFRNVKVRELTAN